MPLPLSSLLRWLVVSTIFLSTPALLSAQPTAPRQGVDNERAVTPGPMHGPGGHPMPGPGFGPGGPGRMPDAGPGRGPAFLQGLQLTEAQRDRVFSIMHATAPAVRERAKAERKAREALRELSASADYTDAKAKALADDAAKAGTALALLHAGAEHDIWALLTPEQREKAQRQRPPGRER